MDYNNLHQSRYQFQIDYLTEKANKAINALSQFLQKSIDKEIALRAENTQIFIIYKPH